MRKNNYLKELKSEKEQAEKFYKTKKDLQFNSLFLVNLKIQKNEKDKEKIKGELKEQEKKLNEQKKSFRRN